MEAEVSASDAANAVQEVLESLLSKKNLVRDQLLAGNMNPQMYIPIRVLLSHEKLQTVGATAEMIAAAAKQSTRLGVSENLTMVRPLLKSKRNVVILRDIPADTTEDEIRALFSSGPHAGHIKHAKPEVNNTWFVKFDVDEGIQDIVLWLRSQKFKGQPVNAAIKSEHFLRSFYPLYPSDHVPTPQMAFSMQPPAPTFAEAPPPQIGGETFEGGGWADIPTDSNLCLGGKIGPPAKGGGYAPPPELAGPQRSGFWQPWGARFQPPPLVFDSSTTLASSAERSQGALLPAAVAEEVVEPEADWKGGWGKGKSKGKGKGKGKGSDEKGGFSYGQTWGNPNSKGGWGAAGGKGAWAPPDTAWWWSAEQQHQPRRRGKGDRPDGAKGKWAARRPDQGEGESDQLGAGIEAPPLPAGTGHRVPSKYEHEFRKYSKEQFLEVCTALRGESLDRPEALERLGSETPIFREAPSLDVSLAS